MKVLQVITSLATGGAEKLIVDMVPKYRARGLEVDVLLFDGTDTPFKRQLQEMGVEVYSLVQGGSVYNPLHIPRLLPYFRKYDIVHTHNTAPQLFAAIAGVLCSVVLCTTEHNTSNRRRDWKWYKPIDRWMYRQYRKVICISDSTEANLRSFIGEGSDKICTIFNGIDVELYAHALPLDKREVTPRPERKVVAMVAGFRYQKDQETLIRSLRHLPDTVELWLVGDGSRRPEIEQCIKDCALEDRVRLLGVRRDVPRVLKAVDVVVQSSHWEGFGLAAAEGMAAGKPVVASNVEGLSQVVEGAGLLFPLGDDKALADILGHLLNDSEFYASVAEKCSQRARMFDISKTVDSYLAVYNELIKKIENDKE